jgi:hypothetical protein
MCGIQTDIFSILSNIKNQQKYFIPTYKITLLASKFGWGA